MKIGWIGLGNMGIPMVKNLVKAGFEVSVFNRNADKSKALSETTQVNIAASPAALASDVDVVITMLSNDAAVREVYEGANGIFSAALTKKLVAVDMSTVSPENTSYIAGLCQQKNIPYLDAPVSGSVKPAEEAQLVIMVGGDEAVYEQVKPIFDALGKASVYLGENGKANVAKLAVNLFLGIVNQGLAEAVVFAEKNGLSAAQLLPIVNAGAVGSGLTKLKTDNIINGNYNAAFALKLLSKDIGLATANGMDTPLGQSLDGTLKGAVEKGYGDEDMIAVLKYLSAN